MRGQRVTRRGWGPLTALALTGIAIAQAMSAGGVAAAPVAVAIDLPAALTGKAAKLSFLLLDGDGAINNTVTVTDFMTNGTLGVGSATGGVSGDLGGTLTLADQDFFNEWLQDFAVGASLKFTLDFTTEFGVGPAPDSFGLALLGANMLPLVTTDLPGDELLHVDLGGFGAGVVQQAQRIEPTPIPLPPTVLVMLAAGLPLAFWAHQGRSR